MRIDEDNSMRLDRPHLATGDHLIGEEGNRKLQAILGMIELFEPSMDILNDSVYNAHFQMSR